jgi:hypothetical protein
MNKKYVKIGCTLYFEDQYGNYLDWEGYNPSGYRWTGTTWVNREGYNPTGYILLNEDKTESIFIGFNNEVFFGWELKTATMIPYEYEFIRSFEKIKI